MALEYRSCPWPGGSAGSLRWFPPPGVLVVSCPSSAQCVRGVPGLLAPVHRCARAVCCVVSAVSWATSLLFTGGPARCGALRVRCPGPLGSCSTVCPLSVLCCVRGVLGHLVLFAGAPAPCVALRARCPGSLGSCSPVCLLCLLFCLCGVLGHLAPVHRCLLGQFKFGHEIEDKKRLLKFWCLKIWLVRAWGPRGYPQRCPGETDGSLGSST